MSENDVSRRAFLRTAAGASAAAGAAATGAGTASAQEGGAEPDFEGYLDGIDGGYEDLRGQDEVTVNVGAGNGLLFSPAGIWIDEGTTVVWEWTGQGGEHNVFSDDQDAAWENAHEFDSGDPTDEAGHTFSYTFEEGGRTAYYCEPHYSVGMWGAVAVGGDVPTLDTGGGGSSVPQVPDAARSLAVATFMAMVATLGLAFFFLKYGGDYEDVQ